MADEILPQTIYDTPEPELEPTEAEERGSLTHEMLERLMEGQKQQTAELIRQMVPPRGQPLQQDSVAPELEFTLEGLPDPAMDPAGFHKGYAARAQAAVSKALQQTRQAVSADAQRMITDKDVISRADAMIKSAVPEADEEIIAYAGGVIASRLKAQGKDPMATMRADTEAVAQDIADYIEDMRGRMGGGRRSADAPTGGRTRGLVQPRARTPNAPRQQETKNDPNSMYKELTDFQRKARIY